MVIYAIWKEIMQSEKHLKFNHSGFPGWSILKTFNIEQRHGVSFDIHLQFVWIEEMVVICKLIFPGFSVLTSPWINCWHHRSEFLCTFSKYSMQFRVFISFSSRKALLYSVTCLKILALAFQFTQFLSTLKLTLFYLCSLCQY